MRTLKSEDRRDEAATVAKLRRPSVAAWAVNQAVRQHRERFDALLEAGAGVQRSQRRALSGVRDSGLRAATRARRQAIDELSELAVRALTAHGANAETHRGDITATFDAASADDDAAATVGAARLSAPLPISSGFGSLDGFALVPDAGDDEEEQAPAPTADGEPDPGAAERERAARRRRQAMREVEQARRALAEAERAAQRADDAVVTRNAAADTAERAARDAEEVWRRKLQRAEELRAEVAGEQERAAQAHQAVEERQSLLAEREQALADIDG